MIEIFEMLKRRKNSLFQKIEKSELLAFDQGKSWWIQRLQDQSFCCSKKLEHLNCNLNHTLMEEI